MKAIKTLLMSLVISTVVFAQNSEVCKIDGESVPDWICNKKPTPESVTVVGSGNSYIEAVSEALTVIEFTYYSDLKQTFKKTDDRKTDYHSVKRLSKTVYGKNIKINASYGKFTRTINHKAESVLTFISKLSIGIDQKDNNSLILKVFKREFYSENKDMLDMPIMTADYKMSLVGNDKLNIIQELEKAGIKILKMYTTKKLKQYILLQVKKDVIDKNINEKELWRQFKQKELLEDLAKEVPSKSKEVIINNLSDEELWKLFQKSKYSQTLDKEFPQE